MFTSNKHAQSYSDWQFPAHLVLWSRFHKNWYRSQLHLFSDNVWRHGQGRGGTGAGDVSFAWVCQHVSLLLFKGWGAGLPRHGQALPGLSTLGLAKLGMARSGRARPCLALLGLGKPGLARLGFAWPGPARPSQAWLGQAWPR